MEVEVPFVSPVVQDVTIVDVLILSISLGSAASEMETVKSILDQAGVSTD